MDKKYKRVNSHYLAPNRYLSKCYTGTPFTSTTHVKLPALEYTFDQLNILISLKCNSDLISVSALPHYRMSKPIRQPFI